MKRFSEKINSNINSLFFDLDNYIHQCNVNAEAPAPIALNKHINNLKNEVGIILDWFYDIEDINEDLKKSLNNSQEINKNLSLLVDKNMDLSTSLSNSLGGIQDINNKQLSNFANYTILFKDINDLFTNFKQFFDEFKTWLYDFKKPIDTMEKMRGNNRSGAMSPRYKGLSDEKIIELLDAGYTRADIVRYTEDARTPCDPYTWAAIDKRCKKLGR